MSKNTSGLLSVFSKFLKFFHVRVQLPAFHDPDAKRKGEEGLVLFEQPTTSRPKSHRFRVMKVAES